MPTDVDEFSFLLKVLGANNLLDPSLVEKPVEEIKKPEEPKKEIRPKRCQHDGCKMKLMLIDFPCKCNKIYCSQHRYSESHDCSYDYKKLGKELLKKELVEVRSSRLDKI
jgi:hypothetical protein